MTLTQKDLKQLPFEWHPDTINIFYSQHREGEYNTSYIFLFSGSTNTKHLRTVCFWGFTLVFTLLFWLWLLLSPGKLPIYGAPFCAKNSEKAFYLSASLLHLAGCYRGRIVPDFPKQKMDWVWLQYLSGILFPPVLPHCSAKPRTLV